MTLAWTDRSAAAWLGALVARCQALAGSAIEPDAPDLPDRIRLLTVDMPTDLAIPARFVVRTQVTTALARTMPAVGISRRPDVAALFFSWSAVDVTSSAWPEDLAEFVSACANAVERRHTGGTPVQDARIDAALRFIDTHYSKRDLSLHDVAGCADLSTWHAARLIKRYTGLRFTAYLNTVRVKAAERLLADRTQGLKEIAATVGYGSASHLSMHFKRVVGMTPGAYRKGLPPSRVA
jgi:AraC-like DNA-binding protein